MIHQAQDHLWWGDIWSVEEAAVRVDAILNVGRETKDYALPGIEYAIKYFPDVDPYPCQRILEGALWIDEKINRSKKVFGHCIQGNSRSAATVVAYLHYSGMAFEDACQLIVRAKPYYAHEGKYVDSPLTIRPWFIRDWPQFTRQLGAAWPTHD